MKTLFRDEQWRADKRDGVLAMNVQLASSDPGKCMNLLEHRLTRDDKGKTLGSPVRTYNLRLFSWQIRRPKSVGQNPFPTMASQLWDVFVVPTDPAILRN